MTRRPGRSSRPALRDRANGPTGKPWERGCRQTRVCAGPFRSGLVFYVRQRRTDATLAAHRADREQVSRSEEVPPTPGVGIKSCTVQSNQPQRRLTPGSFTSQALGPKPQA